MVAFDSGLRALSFYSFPNTSPVPLFAWHHLLWWAPARARISPLHSAVRCHAFEQVIPYPCSMCCSTVLAKWFYGLRPAQRPPKQIATKTTFLCKAGSHWWPACNGAVISGSMSLGQRGFSNHKFITASGMNKQHLCFYLLDQKQKLSEQWLPSVFGLGLLPLHILLSELSGFPHNPP